MADINLKIGCSAEKTTKRFLGKEFGVNKNICLAKQIKVWEYLMVHLKLINFI